MRARSVRGIASLEPLITPHFKKAELACPCCGKFNMPKEMLDFIERVRNNYGRPMKINSAVRCPMHNAKVKGKPSSAHLLGLAIDVHCVDARFRKELIVAATLAGVKGLGLAKTFLHLDLMVRPEGEPAFFY